jgi:hypothetical protein
MKLSVVVMSINADDAGVLPKAVEQHQVVKVW